MTESATSRRIVFLGAGNMASAIFGGMLKGGYPADAILATSRTQARRESIEAEYGIRTTADNGVAVAEADVVVLAVKPQMMRELCESLREAFQARRPLVVSVAAGLDAATLDDWLGGGLAVIRCMPNTPSLVGEGVSGLYANGKVSDDQRRLTTQLFEPVGLVEWVDDERLIDAVTAISGSGPAYFFLFIESLEAAGVDLGLPQESARRLALQTAFGAAKMARQSEFDPAELRRRVTSPNGTTERAIRTFEAAGLAQIVDDAAQACAERARELSQELSQAPSQN
ncbi:pyrroline-5-carboxylate reductase [Salinicola rhizosphaerae]|uniref:Pyrroline-5-carboxylate reductase n=1 Tax=Salinicola rhizosphaerae TaxID=1443141 RepID=A0ABQ3DUH1_9GAMM|nr:pyrroline-5-carboxylate reductase [Salinicola rhizosphaerae]GHB15338.1 pyrroline-5-carboxylate reductase [Salinicola rhizosphaerae]